MPRALITGGLGYIGGNLVMSLLEDGWDITIIDSFFSRKSWDFILDAKYSKRIALHHASVTNQNVVERSMRGVNVVFHLADRSDYSIDPKHTIRMFRNNVIGTSVVLSMARNAGIDSIIFTSTGMVYGEMLAGNESETCLPVDLYSCTKYSAEQVCRHYLNVGMNIKILRIFNVWGGDNSNSVVLKFVNGHNEIYEDGIQTRDFVHCDDVINALKLSVLWDPGIYNIGTGEEVSIAGLYELISNGIEPVYVDLIRDRVI